MNLSDNTKWISKFDEVMSLKLRFQSMSITLHSANQPYIQEVWTENAIQLLLQVTAKYGPSIRRLTMKHAEFENTKDFGSVLCGMPLLRELTLNRVKFNVGDESTNNTNNDQLTMPSELNKLTVTTCDWNIFQFFMASPIKELQISNKFTFVDAQQRAAYMKFLEASAKLESIEFDFASYAKTFITPMDSKIHLKLKRVKYWSFSPSYEIDDIDRNFGTFIESQAESLNELDLNYVSPNIIKTIFSKLKHLEKVRLNAVVLPGNSDFYGAFKPMPDLKELTLHDDIPSEVSVKNILVHCCNLEKLTAHHDPFHYIPNLLIFMTTNNPKLKHLSLDALPMDITPEAKFNHLQYLHIQTCIDLENVIKFLTYNGSIETLSLNLADEITTDDAMLEALLKQSNLQHLIVAARDITLNRIYNRIKVDYKKLKSLELRPLANAADKVFIQFPNDKSRWQPSECIF